ncbi:hypothetical protein TEA_017580 [Camellia sinensis var. sinensis]|uniref:Uncharacterized protein n=1 Tax=Camellia sinensis var. sinensis TaxID=542762 RepID=A0A4S4EFE2_CAMSN|nr:hypothetical protein TEA_017580 [Camellia sinensis var. sinensis]
MLFNHHRPFDEAEMYLFTPSSSSSCSSVDCTLSLGTPSTRLTNNDETEKRVHHDRRSGSRMSNFCWDILQQSKHTASPAAKLTRGPASARKCFAKRFVGIRFPRKEREEGQVQLPSELPLSGRSGEEEYEPPQHMDETIHGSPPDLGPVSFEHKIPETRFQIEETSPFSSPVEMATSWSLTMGLLVLLCLPSSVVVCVCFLSSSHALTQSSPPFALLRRRMFQGFA